MKINKRILVLLSPILILILLTFKPLLTSLIGDEILLKTKPFDPKDILRGDYIYLNYEIEEIDKEKFIDIKSDYNGNVFVVLKKNEKFYDVDYVTKNKPKEKLFLRANVKYNIGDKIFVNYNLNRFYIEENTGSEYDELSRSGNLAVKIVINNGHGIIKQIIPIKKANIK